MKPSRRVGLAPPFADNMIRCPLRASLSLLSVLALFGCTTSIQPPSERTTYAKAGHYYCGVHDVPLKTAVVSIEYGYLRTGEERGSG